MTEKFVITGHDLRRLRRPCGKGRGFGARRTQRVGKSDAGLPGVRQGRECGPRRHCGRRDGGGLRRGARRARPGGTCTRSRTRR